MWPNEFHPEHEIKSRLVCLKYVHSSSPHSLLFKTNGIIVGRLLSDVCIVLPALLLATVWPFMVDLHCNSSQTSSWQQQMYWLRLMDLIQSAVDSKLLCVLGTGWKAPNTPPVPVISLPDIGVETLCVDSQGLERLCWLMGVRCCLEVEAIQKSCSVFSCCEIYGRVLRLTVVLWQLWRRRGD